MQLKQPYNWEQLDDIVGYKRAFERKIEGKILPANDLWCRDWTRTEFDISLTTAVIYSEWRKLTSAL